MYDRCDPFWRFLVAHAVHVKQALIVMQHQHSQRRCVLQEHLSHTTNFLLLFRMRVVGVFRGVWRFANNVNGKFQI